MEKKSFGKRTKFQIGLGGLSTDLNVARDKFQFGAFLEAFDIYEQLVAAYPKQAVVILVELYDFYKRFPYTDRCFD